ncbi:MAG: S-layer homology domain-containing protein [Oscillospiraceae bacterium]|nr:S-layer homology domain-containing protein [Oscillospiraceae bacterium]
MKKILALLLSAIMLLSLVPMAGAASFSDSADVSFTTREAVEIMSDLKIITGFPDGTFKPEDTLTRAQATKILCCVALGVTAADALTAGGTTFSDVPASHWANKFVEYCASKSIVAGVGNGKFDPNGKLTGYAFGKMLLVALGADATALTGANWDKNTRTQLREMHLDYGVNATNNELSRQDACRMALNALFKGEGENPEDTLAYKNFSVMRTDAGVNSGHLSRPYRNYVSDEEDAYWTGAEKKIVASPDYFVKSGAVKGDSVVKQLGVTDIEASQVKCYRNGILPSSYAEKNNHLHAGDSANYYLSGDGMRLEFYYAADLDIWYVIHLFYFPAKVKSVVEATYFSDGTIENEGSVTFENGWSCPSNDFKQSDVGNYACVYGRGKSTMNAIVNAKEAIPGTVIEGKLTAYDKSQLTVDGKTYLFPFTLGTAEEAKQYLNNGGAIGDTVKVLLSDDGFVIMVWQAT